MAQRARRAAPLLLVCALMWLASPYIFSGTDPFPAHYGPTGDLSGVMPEIALDSASAVSSSGASGRVKLKSWVATRSGRLDASTGISRVALSEQDLEAIWRVALECSLNSADGYGAALSLRISPDPGASAAELELDREYFDRIADTGRMSLFLETQFGGLSLDSRAIGSIRLAAGQGNILIRIGKADTSSLPSDLLESIGSRPSACFSVGTPAGMLEEVGGSMSLSLPYQTGAGESGDALVVFELSGGGTVVAESYYSKSSSSVSMNTSRLSSYAVAFRPRVFSDVEPEDWFYGASAFVYRQGISSGRGDGSFGPDDPLTRGEFVYMLLRAYDIKPKTGEPESFADAGGEYYSPYLAAAKRMGVVEGMGDNLFMPEAKLTRQDMCAMLYRALRKLERLPAPGAVTLTGYSDAEEVQDYAREAMAVLIREGIVSGHEGRLSPLESTSRAHMAQMLYNLLEKKK